MEPIKIKSNVDYRGSASFQKNATFNSDTTFEGKLICNDLGVFTEGIQVDKPITAAQCITNKVGKHEVDVIDSDGNSKFNKITSTNIISARGEIDSLDIKTNINLPQEQLRDSISIDINKKYTFNNFDQLGPDSIQEHDYGWYDAQTIYPIERLITYLPFIDGMFTWEVADDYGTIAKGERKIDYLHTIFRQDFTDRDNKNAELTIKFPMTSNDIVLICEVLANSDFASHGLHVIVEFQQTRFYLLHGPIYFNGSTTLVGPDGILPQIGKTQIIKEGTITINSLSTAHSDQGGVVIKRYGKIIQVISKELQYKLFLDGDKNLRAVEYKFSTDKEKELFNDIKEVISSNFLCFYDATQGGASDVHNMISINISSSSIILKPQVTLTSDSEWRIRFNVTFIAIP